MVGNRQCVYGCLHETGLGTNTLQIHIVQLLSESPELPATDTSQKLQRVNWEMSWTRRLPSGEWAGPESSVLRSLVKEDREGKSKVNPVGCEVL